MDNWRFVEEFSAGQELHRILPVGTFKRFGRKVEITADKVRDVVTNFNRAIPETGVPINAEHSRTDGSVGKVTGLVERADGVYAAMQYTEAGQKLITEERFRYVSPEIVWGPTDWEQYDNVSNILVGLALTNSPFFGEQVSLFTLNDQEIGERFVSFSPITISPDMSPQAIKALTASLSDEILKQGLTTVTHPPDDSVGFYAVNNGDTDDPQNNHNEEELVEEQKFFEKFTQWLEGQGKQPQPEPPTGPTPEEFAVLRKEKEELEARLSEQEKERAHAARVAEYSALVPDSAPANLPEDLAQFAADHPEAAKRLAEELAALYTQVEEAGLFNELGSGAGDDEHTNPVEQFNALVKKTVDEKGLDLAQATNEVAKARPDLLKAVRGGK